MTERTNARPTAVWSAADSLRRIATVDRHGPRLGSVPVLSPELPADAVRLDRERAAGRVRGPWHGVPYTIKDSFAARGLPVAAGSPAFAQLVADRDAVVVARLRAAGALLVGRTAMPPMAIGGGQAGLYGRVRSPYNPEYLAAAWHSGSSIGSAVSVAAGIAEFGIGEETVSSGRSPASNNGLVAYTPSWGVVPSAGNWPLHPYRDVVVPHTRTVADQRRLLSVLAGPDDRDVWQRQRALDMSTAHRVAAALRDGTGERVSLAGRRLGVPRLYVGEPYADVVPVALRPSIAELWSATCTALTEAGAELVAVDFPLVEAYEGRSARHRDLTAAGYLPAEWTAFELGPLMTWAWQSFLDDYTDSGLRLADISPYAVRPDPPFAVDAIENGRLHPGRDVFDFAAILRSAPPAPEVVSAQVEQAMTGLAAGRRDRYERWLDELGLDGLVFPANSDIGPYDCDVNPSSARLAWADGAVFSTTNHVLRRFGIPSVTVPMGLTADLGMPVGLTLCGRAYDDVRLLDLAEQIEAVLPPRPAAPLPPTAPLPSTAVTPPAGEVVAAAADPNVGAAADLKVDARVRADGAVDVRIRTGLPSGTTGIVELAGLRLVVPAGDHQLDVVLDRALRAEGAVDVLVVLSVVDTAGQLTGVAFAEAPFTRPL
ncbi:amidase [Micromonospora pallida]|uniref:Amidase n=1 Tax=Micromonospora pallida TaxID=145854 RepID=A0A1C6T6E4_9ACTN|nr:amidase family protein [Micromonospora pallida]SCL37015.1 amidase [Micromonospora pallida]